jgi:hypothetical protein
MENPFKRGSVGPKQPKIKPLDMDEALTAKAAELHADLVKDVQERTGMPEAAVNVLMRKLTALLVAQAYDNKALAFMVPAFDEACQKIVADNDVFAILFGPGGSTVRTGGTLSGPIIGGMTCISANGPDAELIAALWASMVSEEDDATIFTNKPERVGRAVSNAAAHASDLLARIRAEAKTRKPKTDETKGEDQ